MGVEIERKFLVKGELPVGEDMEIIQAYLCIDPERTIRVRLEGEVGTLTIKGMPAMVDGKVGISRAEFEYRIPKQEVEELIQLAVGVPILKTRRKVLVGAHVWEVDIFKGDNAGLVVAEVELSSETEEFELPAWAGEDVSHELRYTNSQLMQVPFKEW